MSIAPHTGIVDFGTFTPPTASTDGIQGEVPMPLAGQEAYVLTATGWAPGGGGGGSGTVTQIDTGTGLTGGPITTTGTVALANTAVSPGSYTNANITVDQQAVSYTHLRAHETSLHLVCRLLLEKKPTAPQ